MNPADPLAALFAQYLSGGVKRQVEPVQLGPGPSFGPGAPMPGGDGAASGFETLGEGLLDYLEGRKTEEEEGPTNQTPATGWTFDPARDMPPMPPAAQPEPLGLGQTPATGYIPGGGSGAAWTGTGQNPSTGYVPTPGVLDRATNALQDVVTNPNVPRFEQGVEVDLPPSWGRMTPAQKRAWVEMNM